MQGAFSTVFLRVAVPVTHPLCPPTSPHPLVGWLPCVEAVLSRCVRKLQRHFREWKEKNGVDRIFAHYGCGEIKGFA